MPRYLFHVRTNGSDLDSEGMVLPDMAAARAAGLKLAGGILSYGPPVEANDWRIEVADEAGLTLFTIRTILTESPAVPHRKR